MTRTSIHNTDQDTKLAASVFRLAEPHSEVVVLSIKFGDSEVCYHLLEDVASVELAISEAFRCFLASEDADEGD